MSKVKVIDKKSIKSINSERELLSKLYHPFIVNMYYAFQDDKYLYLVMDLLTGGDLRYHISIHKRFSEEQTRFFICGITLSLEYIHLNNIIHRDVKPENLVLDENGYIRLTDFGIAKINTKDNSSETSGTPGYMCPEVIKSLNHSYPADFFALGVIGYEFMKGERPYNGKSRKEIKEQMMARQAEIKMEEINDENWSKESVDFINKLLMRKPEERLGFKNGIQELKDHPWLRYYPWDLIKNKSLPAPFVPQNKDNFDIKYCQGVEYIGDETKLRYEEILSDDNYEFYFKNFYYNIDEDKNRNKINNELLLMNNKEKKGKNKKDKKEKRGKLLNNKSIDKLNGIIKINNLFSLYNQVKRNNNKKKKYEKMNFTKNIEKSNKLDNSNFILINFNINNIANNNINKNKINNYYLHKNNIKSERLKKINKKININKNRVNKINYNNFGSNDLSINQISLHSPLNSSIKLPIKNTINITKSLSKSKSKNKNKKGNIYNFNNSLIKKLTKFNLSQVRLLKNKNKNNSKNKNYKVNHTKFYSQIYSISYSNRDKDSHSKNKDKNNNKSLNTISLNESKNKNNSRKINTFFADKKMKYLIKNKSIKKVNSKPQQLFDKKNLINGKIDSKNNKKLMKNNIPFSNSKKNYESLLKREKNKTLQNKDQIIKKIIYIFKKNKKVYDSTKKLSSNKSKKNNVLNKYNNYISHNYDKDIKLIDDNSERLKHHRTYFSEL